MVRIAVIGCGGSGKSWLSNQLGALTGAPVTHLDAVYYDDQWNALAPERFAARQYELVAAPAWVIEGNYASTLAIRLKRADTVVFLDFPAWICFLGIVQWRVRYGGGQMASAGVCDRIIWGFIRCVWSYRRTVAPRVEGLVREHADQARVHHVTSRREARALLDGECLKSLGLPRFS